jgi:hypothetical protein
MITEGLGRYLRLLLEGGPAPEKEKRGKGTMNVEEHRGTSKD